MVVAGDLGDMLDMVGDQRRPSPRGAGCAACPRLQRRRRRRPRAGRCIAPSAALPRRRWSAAHCQNASRHEAGHEIDHHHAAVGGQQLEHVVGDVARVVVERARRCEWEKITGASAGLRARPSSSRAMTWLRSTSMPMPVHLVDDRAAESVRPSIFGIVGRAVGPFGVLVVGQRHVARAEVVELAQRGEAAADLVPALDPDQRGDLARLVDADDVVGGAGQLEVVADRRRPSA